MKKFKIKIDSNKVSDIKKKIESYNWDNMPDVKGWDLGCNKKILKNLCSYWLKKYNWNEQQEKFNLFKAWISP